MQKNYKQTQELMDNVVNELIAYKELIGPMDDQKESTYGFVPGLEMKREAKNIDYQLKKLREGIFQVLFTGVFSSGKSTLLNALMRRDILQTSINAETAVITKIIFNADEKVIVVKKKTDKNGKPLSEEYTVESFFDRYRVSQDNPEKFMDVDYVVLQQPQDGIGGRLVQLVDSPGTNNSEADDVTAHEFAQKASAIVFLINATHAFNFDEKEYINNHFAGKKMKNLFFVINHIDGVNPDQISLLKDSVRRHLTNVFTAEDGSFDEKLFNSRVFYTNAYGSLMARSEKQIQTPYGFITVDDNMTGVPQFETGLEEFLTDGERDKNALSAYLPEMANIYVSAEERVDNKLQQLSSGLEEVKSEKEELERYIQKTESIIEGIKISCDTAVRNIIISAKNEYESFVNRVDTEWEKHFDSTVIENFSVKDVFQIALNKMFSKKNSEKMKQCEEKMKPITDAIKSYCDAEMDIMRESLELQIRSYMDKLENELQNYKNQLEAVNSPVDIKQIFEKFQRENMNAGDNVGEIRSNVFQMALAFFGGDADLMVAGVSGQKSNKEFLLKFISTNVMDYIALNIYWPLGVAYLVGKLIKIIKNIKNAGNETAKSLISKVRPETVNELREGKDRFIVEFEKNVGGPILAAGNEFSNSFTEELNGYLKSFDSTIAQLENDESAEAHEKERTSKLLSSMVECFNNISTLTGGKEYSTDEIRNLAIGKNK